MLEDGFWPIAACCARNLSGSFQSEAAIVIHLFSVRTWPKIAIIGHTPITALLDLLARSGANLPHQPG
jgi:hypothetical protein